MATFIAGPLHAYAHESITVDSTAGGKSLTAATYDAVINANGVVTNRHPKLAVVTVEDQNLRWACNPGTTVSSTVGHLAQAGDVISIEGYENIKNFRAIRATGTDSNLRVTFYRTD